MACDAYDPATSVTCDGCSKKIRGLLWHCQKGDSKAHKGGFDLCIECGKTYDGRDDSSSDDESSGTDSDSDTSSETD